MNDVIRDYTGERVARLIARVDDSQTEEALTAIATIITDLGRQVDELQRTIEEYLR